MGWKDNCPSCGGHPNQDGDLLHKPACQVTGSPRKTFMDGVMLNLVIMETRVMMWPEGTPDKWEASPMLIEKAIKVVVSRFEKMELSALMHDQIINAAMKELEHGI